MQNCPCPVTPSAEASAEASLRRHFGDYALHKVHQHHNPERNVLFVCF